MPRVAGVSSRVEVRWSLLSLSPTSVWRCLESRRIGEPICSTVTVCALAAGFFAMDRPSYASAPTASASEASRRRDCSVETLRPRRAATARGLSSFLSASKVARTRLYGFDDPIDFDTTSCMPTASNTARIGPPAMMPVPCGAARSTTLPAPWRPWTSWCSVRPSRSATRIIERLAASVALRIASGTSRALPWPKPTRPFWSPTTTSAAKPKRRPPFTTLATRLMCTSRSTNSLSFSRSPERSLGSLAMSPSHLRGRRTRSLEWDSFDPPLEIEPALAGGVGQRLDAAVIEIAAAVEHHLLHAGGAGALRNHAPDLFRRVDIGTGLQLAAHVLLERGGGGDRDAALVVDDLRIDLLRGAEHRQPRAAVRRLADGAADPRPAAVPGSEVLSHGSCPYFFLPSLRKMNSLEYFTPLPL